MKVSAGGKLRLLLAGVAGGAAAAWIWPGRRYQALSEETPACLWVAGRDGRKIWVNAPLARLLGIRGRRLPGDWTRFLHPDEAAEVKRLISETVANRGEYYHDHRLRGSDGEYRWVSVRAHPRFVRGKFAGYAGAVFDITRRKAAEELAEARAALMRGQTQALELIARGAPLDRSLDVLLRAVESRYPEMITSILLLEGGAMRHIAAPSLPGGLLRAFDGEKIGPRAGSCGTAAYRNELVVVEDIAGDDLWRDYRAVALEYGLRACWSMPICEEHGRVLGTFAVYSRAPRRPEENHIRLLHGVAHTASIAIVRHMEAEALRASEERLRLAITAAEIGIWDWDMTANRLTWSDTMKSIFGWSDRRDEEITMAAVFDAIHPEDRPLLQEAVNSRVAGAPEARLEFRVIRPDGAERWVATLGRTRFDEQGSAARTVGAAVDITGRRHAEEEIRRRDEQLTKAQQIARLGSYEWNIGTDRIYRSAELCRIYGIRPDEFEPGFEGCLARVHPEDRERARARIEQALRERKPFAGEERIVRADGAVRILLSQGEWVGDKHGRPVTLVGTCQDITEQKDSEERLRAAHAALAEELQERVQAERQIRALSAVLIHAQEEERARVARELHDDLSQQIAAVSIALSSLKKGLPNAGGDLAGQTERIRQKVVSLSEAVRRLSHELHPAILQHAGLAEALEGYSAELKELSGIDVTIETRGSFADVTPPAALCVYRVAQEALRNVIKHAGVRSARLELSHEHGLLRLVVGDDGAGMQTSPAATGSGLGLISMKERARLVNGVIEIRSAPGEGTTLVLSIPDGN